MSGHVWKSSPHASLEITTGNVKFDHPLNHIINSLATAVDSMLFGYLAFSVVDFTAVNIYITEPALTTTLTTRSRFLKWPSKEHALNPLLGVTVMPSMEGASWRLPCSTLSLLSSPKLLSCPAVTLSRSVMLDVETLSVGNVKTSVPDMFKR